MTVHEMAEALRCAPVRENDAGRKLAETVRRWTSDHASNGKPCHCLLCTALARYDQETAR